MKIGALFAGVGGLDIAAERVFGARTAWVSEFDAAPSRILAERFPDAPNLGDVTKVDWSAVEPVDIITGGSPCQDLSHAGKRAGMKAGTRSGLWASMCDAIETIRPRFVVWENVRGALSAEATAGEVESCEFCVGDGRGAHLRALGRVLGDLAELGYDAAWCGLRAADVGAPHGRFRVFVLAWPADAESDAGRQRDGDRGAAADSDGAARGERRIAAPRQTEGGRPRADAGGRGGTPADDVSLLPTPTTEPTTGNGHARNLGGEVRTLLPTPTASDHKASGSAGYGGNEFCTLTDATVRQAERFGTYADAIARWEPVVGRPAPAPTEPTGKGGAHRLSPRFVEWMMGLPDGWVTDVGLSRNEQLKALGNGVVPQQAEAALGHMLTVRSLEAVTS